MSPGTWSLWREILNRWTDYCTELYNHKANGDPSVLDCPQTDTEDDHPILRREVEAAVQSLKKGKSAGLYSIQAKLVQTGGEDVITSLTTNCNKIWQTGEWPTPWTQSLVITLPKKGNLQQCQNYRTISLISHPSKVMLKTTLNRLKPQAEKIIAEKQAGFRAWRSTKEQIFNLQIFILCEKYLHLPCLHRFQESFQQGMACSFVGNHEEVHDIQPHHAKHWTYFRSHIRSAAQLVYGPVRPNTVVMALQQQFLQV